MNYSSCLRPGFALFRLSDPLILLLLSQADGMHYNKQIVIDKMIGETGRVGGVAPVDRLPPVYCIKLIAGRIRPWVDKPHGRAFDIYFIRFLLRYATLIRNTIVKRGPSWGGMGCRDSFLIKLFDIRIT